MPDVSERDLELPGGRVHLLEAGSGPPVVLLHPLPGDGRFFAELVPRLPSRYRLIVPDLPGNGRSAKPAAAYTLASQADALLELLDRLEVERAVWVGASYGGILSLFLASRFPRCTQALVLSGTNAYRDFHFPFGARLLSSSAGRLLLPFIGRRVLERSYKAEFARPDAIDPAHFDALWRSIRERGGRFSLWKQAHEIDFDLVEPYLGSIDVPTLLLWGAEDRASPLEWAHRLERDLAHARLEVLEACGHYPALERPEGFAALTTGFLDEVTACRATA